MRVMWCGIPPWLPTGYGQQAAVWCKALRDAGHEVVVQAMAGLSGHDMEWETIPVYSRPQELLAEPLILEYRLNAFKPDVVFVLCQHRNVIMPEVFRDYKTVALITGDCDRLSALDAQFLQRSQAVPWAISRHMQRQLEDAGYDAPYVPHAIGTGEAGFCPPADRAAERAANGVGPGELAVGINARNDDPQRKAIAEQVYAFAAFRKRHPSARLFLHSLNAEWSASPVPVVLQEVCADAGLKSPVVTISYQPLMYLEQYPREALVRWYQSMDVVMNASRGEGFGLAAVEAQACGTPVILADNTTGPELRGPGWLASCDHDHWQPAHKARWAKPLHKSLVDCLVKAAAVKDVAGKRLACRQFALDYSVESVWPLFEKALAELSLE
jgi:glycosyltransferase involved in cell wall biosynthesis